MSRHHVITRLFSSASLLLVASGLLVGGGASALASTTSQKATTGQQTQAAHLQTIISKGDQEISRRLTTLGTLTGKISAATKLSSADKASLSGEVSSEVSGLTALKSKLDAETSVDAARSDAQSIYTDYRVYALIVPKAELVKVADDQQVVEGKLNDLATKLQSRLTSAQSAGKDVSSPQSQLDDLKSKTASALGVSSTVESKVVNLQPSDYNSDHAILGGDAAQLKTARSDNTAAFSDAKSLVAALKNL